MPLQKPTRLQLTTHDFPDFPNFQLIWAGAALPLQKTLRFRTYNFPDFPDLRLKLHPDMEDS